jgi:2-oxo-4-hydroxy-4-carboxy-5-ureidoimidazoline decarboxylase
MTIAAFDHLQEAEKRKILSQCCGSEAWISKMLQALPAEDLVDLVEIAEDAWYQIDESDWREAFSHHPRIGDLNSLKDKFKSTASLAGEEQASVETASEQTLRALAEQNQAYEKKFGYIFIVCATGKSAEEMLGLLITRLQNDADEEIQVAMEEQNRITKLRLEKFFES